MQDYNLSYLYASASAACELIDLLPSCDLVDELKNLLNTQAYVSNLMLINKPLPKSECEEYILCAKESELGALRIKHANLSQKQV